MRLFVFAYYAMLFVDGALLGIFDALTRPWTRRCWIILCDGEIYAVVPWFEERAFRSAVGGGGGRLRPAFLAPSPPFWAAKVRCGAPKAEPYF